MAAPESSLAPDAWWTAAGRDTTGWSLAGPYSPARDPTVVVLAVITLGTLAAMVLGVGPAGGIAPGSGPVFPLADLGADGADGTDDGDVVTLRVAANATEVRAGERVRIRVSGAGDEPVNATVRVGDRRYHTGEDGTVVVPFGAAGTYRVRARKATTGETRYRNAATTVVVERRTVALSVDVNRTDLRAGDAVAVRVTRPDGSPADATVVLADLRRPTGPDGVAVVRPPRAGTFPVTAHKPPTAAVRYPAGSATLRVERRRVELRASVNASPVAVDAPVAVTATRADDGTPVEAVVLANGTRRPTGPDGRVGLRFGRAGDYRVRVRAAPTPAIRFENASATVRVRRRAVDLALSASPDELDAGEEVTLVLRRTDTGERVAGAVRIGGVAYDTGPDGRLAATLYDPGRATFRAEKAPTRTERFRPAASTVLVRGPDLSVAGLSAPEAAAPGERVTIEVTVENGGTEGGSANVTLRVGEATRRRTVELAPGERRTLTLPVRAPGTPGGYAVVAAVDGAVARATLRVETAAGSTPPRATGGPRAATDR